MSSESQSRPHYRQPPILEAVCEIHFAPVAKPEKLHVFEEMWRANYPTQQIVEQQSLQVQLKIEGSSVQQKVLGTKLICRSTDDTKLVQLSDTFLAVNQLRPYPGWKQGFEHAILERWAEVHKELNIELIHRIGLRYINRIELPQYPLCWSDWFNFDLPLPDEVKGNDGHFQMSFQQTLAHGLKCTVNIASVEAPPGFSWVILDLDVTLDEKFPIENLPSRLAEVRKPHSRAFEAYIKPNLRALFQPIAQA